MDQDRDQIDLEVERMVRIEDVVRDRWSDEDPILWWDGVWWKAQELFDLASRMEASLVTAGFRRGYRLVVLMPNCPALLGLSLACWRLGGTVASLNPASGAEGLVAALRHGEPSTVVVGDSIGEKLAPGLNLAEVRWSSISPEGEGGPFRCENCTPSSDDIALLFATSGTTGRPKAVPLTHNNVISDVQQSLDKVRMINREDVFLNVLPNFHTLGFVVSGILPLITGCRQAIMPSFMPPERVLDCIDLSGVTVMVGVPTMLRFLVAGASKAGRRFSSIRLIISGGDRFPPELDRRVEDVFGVPVLEGYGLTECSPVLAVNPDYSSRKLGTAGPILDQVEWQVRSEEGEVLHVGEEGILWVRGPSVVTEYFGTLPGTGDRFEDGWFNTGDVVVVDRSGYVSIMDRASDVIIVGGFNVYPQEVENVLVSFPGVKEAAVVGCSNSMSGQVPLGYVIAEGEDISSSDLIAYCKERLAHYKVPRKIHFVQDLPRNSLGKVLRRVLRDELSGKR
nr:AMP-binding protein [uncultured Dethiosulfovibrio sp.]